MLLFRDEEAIAAWCQETGKPRGEVVRLETVWELSQLWYGPRLSADYRGRSQHEAEAILRQVGLTSDFWRF